MAQSPVPGPGYAGQARARTLFRVLGVVSMTVALVLIGIAIADFVHAFNAPLDPTSDTGTPTKFWLFFVAMPFFLVGGFCLNAGFVGAASKYAAGETAPVVKDTAAYLTDGRGLMGVGRTDDDAQGAAGTTPARATGPFCRACGTRNDEDARFCDACGQSMA